MPPFAPQSVKFCNASLAFHVWQGVDDGKGRARWYERSVVRAKRRKYNPPRRLKGTFQIHRWFWSKWYSSYCLVVNIHMGQPSVVGQREMSNVVSQVLVDCAGLTAQPSQLAPVVLPSAEQRLREPGFRATDEQRAQCAERDYTSAAAHAEACGARKELHCWQCLTVARAEPLLKVERNHAVHRPASTARPLCAARSSGAASHSSSSWITSLILA